MAEDPTPAPLTVSVVIPTTGRDVLAESVGRTLDQDPLEVVVVADRQPDRVREILTTNGLDGDPRLRVVPGPARGAAPARQVGSDLATGDIVLFLDDDVVPDPGLVAGHRDAHAVGPGRVVVGYIPVAAESVRSSVAAAIYSADYEAECAELDANPELILLALWSGSVSMRRSDCLRVPQAVPTFEGLLLEDTELGLRCAQAGLVGVFDRRLTAVHHHNQSIEVFLRNAARQTEGALVLARRYPGSFHRTRSRQTAPRDRVGCRSGDSGPDRGPTTARRRRRRRHTARPRAGHTVADEGRSARTHRRAAEGDRRRHGLTERPGHGFDAQVHHPDRVAASVTAVEDAHAGKAFTAPWTSGDAWRARRDSNPQPSDP